ncbi:MAG: hypothetical protein KDC95_05435 [Planctomycetes bacterium]|nr:hypothetical protein [Planctomycetota bacterium]
MIDRNDANAASKEQSWIQDSRANEVRFDGIARNDPDRSDEPDHEHDTDATTSPRDCGSEPWGRYVIENLREVDIV